MDEDDCMVSVAKFYLEFIVEESCGKCVPCRIGNKRMLEILTKITKGNGTMADLDTLRNLAMVVKDTALCGLGQTSPNPVLSTMDNFWDEYVAHVTDKVCPAHRCQDLTHYTSMLRSVRVVRLVQGRAPLMLSAGSLKQPHVINQDICIKCGTCYKK